MGLNYDYCCRFIGQPVVAHCMGGKRYYGIVQSVTNEYIVMRGLPGGVGPVSSNSKKLKLTTADKPEKGEIEPVQYYGGYGYGGYGYGANYVLPLYVLLALSLAWI